MKENQERHLKVADLAKRWGVACSTIRKFINSGELIAWNKNAYGERPAWRIDPVEAEAFEKRRRNVQKAKRRKPMQPAKEFIQ